MSKMREQEANRLTSEAQGLVAARAVCDVVGYVTDVAFVKSELCHPDNVRVTQYASRRGSRAVLDIAFREAQRDYPGYGSLELQGVDGLEF